MQPLRNVWVCLKIGFPILSTGSSSVSLWKVVVWILLMRKLVKSSDSTIFNIFRHAHMSYCCLCIQLRPYFQHNLFQVRPHPNGTSQRITWNYPQHMAWENSGVITGYMTPKDEQPCYAKRCYINIYMYNYISFKFNFSSKMWARCSPEERGRTSMPCCNAVLVFFLCWYNNHPRFLLQCRTNGRKFAILFSAKLLFHCSFCVNHSKLKGFYPSRLLFRVYMRGPKITMETMTHK